MDSYLDTLASYVPNLVVRQLLKDPAPIYEPRLDHLTGVVLFADISGFTPLTETLVQGGLEGLETLSNILNRYFGEIIDLILAHGGDILKFAGDALLAVWPIPLASDRLEEATHLAAQCALAIQDYSQDYAQSGHVTLRLRISLGAGELCVSHVGGCLQRWEYSVSGDAVAQMRQASEVAEPGWVVLSLGAWRGIADQAQGRPLRGGNWQLHFLSPVPRRSATVCFPEQGLEAGLRNYIPAAILERLAAGHSEWLAEYRRVTLLFIRLPVLSKQVCLQQLQTFMQMAQTALYHYEGSVNKISVDNKGTALMAAFGLPPFAHENDPERALKAALKLQSQMQVQNWPCSIGISSGNVFCGTIGNDRRREYTMMGDVVIRAARLMEIAGQRILCDRTTYESTQARLAFRSLPAVLLKGLEYPIPIFQPLGFLQPYLVPAATLIGADQERQHLIQAAEQLINQREGQVAIIQGDAGLGKSQLLANFLQWTTTHDLAFALGAAEAVEQFTPYYAWRQILHKLLGLKEIRDRKTRGHHLVEHWLSSNPELAKLAPLLNLVLDVELPETELTQQIQGKVRAENIQTLLLHLLQIGIQEQATLLILEDAHWLDSASWHLLLLLQEQPLPLLFVLATRPLTHAPPPDYVQLCQLETTHLLTMPVLTRSETPIFLAQQLGIQQVSSSVAEFIYAKAEGHPLFSEEVAYALRDQGYLQIKAGVCHFTTPDIQSLEALGLPDTIKGLMTSRFDRLSPAQQLLLKVASAIGRSFFYPLLHDIYPLQEDKAQLLEHLQGLHQQELVLLEASEPELAYMFRHIMIQEVAYNQMLFAQRRDLHREIAQWYEQQHPEQATVYSVLAYHWSRAEVPHKALEYLGKAGEQMLKNGSCQEAAEFFSQVLATAKTMPQPPPFLQVARWHRQLGDAYLGLGQLQASELQFYAALQSLQTKIPQTSLLFGLALSGQILQQLWHCLGGIRWVRSFVSAQTRLAQVVRDQRLELTRSYVRLGEVFYYTHRRTLATYASIAGLNLAETVGPSPELARIYANTCFAVGLQGRHGLAQRYGQLATQTLEQLPKSLPCFGWISLVLGAYNLGIGHWSLARDHLQRGIHAFQEINDFHHLAEALSSLARVNHCQGDFLVARQLWQQVQEIGGQHRDYQAQAWGLLGQAEEVLALGQRDQAQPLIEDAGCWLAQRDDLIIDQMRLQGLSALVACEAGDFNRAQHAAGMAMDYIQQSPPIAAYVYECYSGIVQVYYQLWQAAERHPSYTRLLHQACAAMDAYAKAFPIGKARALHWRATVAQAKGQRRNAKQLWQTGLMLAQTLNMPHEQTRIRNAMVLHGQLGRTDGAS